MLLRAQLVFQRVIRFLKIFNVIAALLTGTSVGLGMEAVMAVSKGDEAVGG